jgi:hypothetical protein
MRLKIAVSVVRSRPWAPSLNRFTNRGREALFRLGGLAREIDDPAVGAGLRLVAARFEGEQDRHDALRLEQLVEQHVTAGFSMMGRGIFRLAQVAPVTFLVAPLLDGLNAFVIGVDHASARRAGGGAATSV